MTQTTQPTPEFFPMDYQTFCNEILFAVQLPSAWDAHERMMRMAPALLEMCKRARGVLGSLPPHVANTKNIMFDLENTIAQAEGRA